ncbi:MAG: hypothetical protein E7181_03275 [Erysipelotrichaceae bacterium]|jgi:uncharacterized protein (UPF0248 family)|nr:hypothetical protein [Erysipelotrichaceae bacterium]
MPLSKFEDVLDKDGELYFTNVGFSMYPLIRQREDILYIIKTDIYHKGDIVLYKYNDKYILHRIIKIKDNIIVTAGDYNYFIDKKIDRSLLLGKLIEIRKKDGRVINLNKDKKMRKFFYSNFIYIRMPIQYLLSKLHLRRVK